METEKLLDSVLKRLNVLIALNLRVKDEDISIKEGVQFLTRFGLEPIEIAEILNTTANVVNVTKSRIKQKRK